MNSQYLASYNWLDRANCTIVAPGEPPQFKKPDKPTKFREGSGTYYRNQNASRHPTYPLEPMSRSNPAAENRPSILVEAVGDTVFFLRREKSPFETIPGVYGYGHSFPEAYTAWAYDMRGSESYQRILEYEFAGMKALIRFEGDGFLPERVPGHGDRPKAPPSGLSSNSQSYSDTRSIPRDTMDEELLESMANTADSAAYPTKSTEQTKSLRIEKRERRIPQSTVFDLKSRSRTKIDADTASEEMPRLWVAQIPNFMLAHHESGVFTSIKIIDTKDAIQAWEEEYQKALAEFAARLRRLVAFARSMGKFEIVRENVGEELELREQGGDITGVLPPDLMET
ncbi:hypothetical protein N7508_011102 [Penicillium antarcticum]|uniref:uncharacterized protein n=1 Tax=Penicillium antarcticum TaxID=416450 RepID=UPI00238BCA61|nr:uncharacterized protein N7508_011102 [Penicillium antarcticum]KAJ5288327.1 hypothetical protein N7508_011102 [Penicillium antarcticum]